MCLSGVCLSLEPEPEPVVAGPKVNVDLAFIWLIGFSIDSQMIR